MKINNLTTNANVTITAQVGCISILEHKKDLSVNPGEAMGKYFCSEMGVNRRQALITLNNSEFVISAGAMQWTAGSVTMTSNVKGVGDLFGKMIAGKVTGESAIKPKYQGSGYLMLEPTYKHLLIERVEDWNGGIVVDDGLFLGSEASVKHTVVARSNFSSAVAGGEGLFNLALEGQGLVLLESNSPRTELVEIILEGEEVRIDGNYAIAWSKTLDFRVEKSGKSLLGSAVSGEGLVNVYRGHGKIMMMPLR